MGGALIRVGALKSRSYGTYVILVRGPCVYRYGLPGDAGIELVVSVRWVETGQVGVRAHQATVLVRACDADLVINPQSAN